MLMSIGNVVTCGYRASCRLRRARDEQLLWSDVISAVEPFTVETPAALAQAISHAVQCGREPYHDARKIPSARLIAGGVDAERKPLYADGT